jgi:hypothetical protein
MLAHWSFDVITAAIATAAAMALWWIGYALTFAPF